MPVYNDLEQILKNFLNKKNSYVFVLNRKDADGKKMRCMYKLADNFNEGELEKTLDIIDQLNKQFPSKIEKIEIYELELKPKKFIEL